MMRMTALVFVALLMCSSALSAQDLTGDWQGTLGDAPRQLRLILHIEKGDGSAWKATLASIDQSPDWGAGMPVDAVTMKGTSVKLPSRQSRALTTARSPLTAIPSPAHGARGDRCP